METGFELDEVKKMGAEEAAAMEEEKPASHNPRTNPITAAQFLSWKRQKDAEASAKRDETSRKRVEDIASGVVQMNGRELFLHQPWVFDNTQY